MHRPAAGPGELLTAGLTIHTSDGWTGGRRERSLNILHAGLPVQEVLPLSDHKAKANCFL